MSARSLCAAVGLSSLCAATSVACGSSDDSSGLQPDAASGADAMGGQCPATVALTIGARCTDEGLLCAPEYTCNLVQVPLLCVCSTSRFTCTDGSGNSIVAGQTPDCPPAVDAGCPLDENSANLAPCAEVGLLCEYPSACGVGVDSCQCTRGALVSAGPSLVFDCQQAACIASEAGIITGDGGPDADAGPNVDATLDAGLLSDVDASVQGIDSAAISDSGAQADTGAEGAGYDAASSDDGASE